MHLSLWNVRLSLPQTVGGVFIERLADYLLVKSVFGFSLAWDGGSGVYLKMSEEHQGAPCGLCGNFNHLAGDDLTTARGKAGLSGPSSSYPFSQRSLPLITIIILALIKTNYNSGRDHSGRGRGRLHILGLKGWKEEESFLRWPEIWTVVPCLCEQRAVQ